MNESNAICCFVLMAFVLLRMARLHAGEDGRSIAMAWLAVLTGRNPSGRLVGCLRIVSLKGALPVAIWLSSGWDGLILHWLGHWHGQAGTTCVFESATQTEPPPFPASFAGAEISEGDASCAVVSSEAH
jgi:hypothetical protein